VKLGADLDATTPRKLTALMMASEKGHTDLVQVLLEKKVNIQMTNGFGYTALSLATEAGHADIVGLLEGAGAASKSGQIKFSAEEL
jgi:ankyrin repeat protein